MFKLMIHKLRVGGVFLVLTALAVSGYADDIEDSIKEALKFYENGEYQEAVESLNYASQLIQQKKGKGLESFLPKPLSGWTAQDASSQAAGTAMFGGGVTAERKYSKGSSSISVKLMTDSPLVQTMSMMFSNPMFTTSDGGKLERIGQQKAVVKHDSKTKRGEIKIVVANRILVMIDGREVTKEDLIGYAKAIDYKKLKSLP